LLWYQVGPKTYQPGITVPDSIIQYGTVPGTMYVGIPKAIVTDGY